MQRFRRRAVALSFLVLVAMLAGCAGTTTPPPTPTGDEAVTFSDRNLEAAVRDVLGKPAGEEIMAAELDELDELKVNNAGISDISPLEHCTNLRELSLDKNYMIIGISPLVENSGLGAGDELRLRGNDLDLWVGSEDMENIRALRNRGAVVHY